MTEESHRKINQRIALELFGLRIGEPCDEIPVKIPYIKHELDPSEVRAGHWWCEKCGSVGEWPDEEYDHLIEPRDYMGNIGWAWKVVDELNKRRIRVHLTSGPTGEYACHMETEMAALNYCVVYGKSIPEAICRAALRLIDMQDYLKESFTDS